MSLNSFLFLKSKSRLCSAHKSFYRRFRIRKLRSFKSRSKFRWAETRPGLSRFGSDLDLELSLILI